MEIKRASILRRVTLPGGVAQWNRVPRHASAGLEGSVCAFELTQELPITLEAVSGRSMIVAPGDVFLGSAGYRESTRWVVGSIPEGGLVPGNEYWVLADCGIVGDLIGQSPAEKPYVGRVKYLHLLRSERGENLNVRQFAVGDPVDAADHGAPIHLLVGTSAEVGKTTAGISVVRALRQQGHSTLVVLKATGTASVGELLMYQDFGAAHVFDCVDFGLPATFPTGRDDIERLFRQMLGTCLSIAADAVVIECGSDMLGANVPAFLKCLKAHRRDGIRVILAAADSLGALGGVGVLRDMGITVDLITGPCTDTPTLRERTERLCGIPAMNMSRS